jgi:SAM-dependent methyltransferase
MDTYDSIYFPLLFAVEDRHFWFRGRNAAIRAIVERLRPQPPSNFRALEVGCGTGNTLRMLEEATGGALVGMDLFAQGLSYARRRVACPLLQADLRQPPFDSAFDFVGLFDVLEHLPDDLAALRHLRHILRPGGFLCLTVPAHRRLWSYADEAGRHVRRYEKTELAEKLVMAGFGVEALSFYMASVLPLMWLGRRLAGMIRRNKSGYESFRQELRVIPVFNEIMLLLLQWETRLLAQGRALPFGVSLLAVGRKPGA